MISEEQVCLPAHWASYLVNGDASGMDDDDVEQVDYVIAHLFPECSATCVNVDDDAGFVNFHDARVHGVLPCDCATFTFHIV